MSTTTLTAVQRHARPSAQFAAKVTHSTALLRLAQSRASAGGLVQASSLGAEDMVVTHLMHLAGLPLNVFVLDTGHLHAETLALLPRLQARYGRGPDVFRPVQEAVVEFVAQHGEWAMRQSVALRQACCHLRKVEPLQRALAGRAGWITGLRREQSSHRQQLQELEAEPLQEDPGRTRLKVSPLLDWTWGDVWHFIALHQLDYNPLHDRFFPSIGCAPCTRAISLGEDFRAGRWWWEQTTAEGSHDSNASAKECGLHMVLHSPST